MRTSYFLRVGATAGAVILALFVPSSARADGNFVLQTASLSPTTEGVTLTVWAPAVIGCPTTPPYCRRATTTVRVSPCPPGLPCTGGAYEVSVEGLYPVLNLDLATGTTYTFTGTGVNEVGPSTTPCTYNCSSPFDMTELTYQTHAPGSVGTWDIHVLGSDGDMVFVAARIVGVNSTTNRCVDNSSFHCSRDEMFVTVTPCPLDLPGYSNPCSGGTNHEIWWQSWPTPITFALAKGETYTLSGRYQTWGLERDITGICMGPNCYYTEYATDATFSANPLSIHATTWGQVKSMYRK